MEGEPVSLINSDGRSPILLMCEHASPALPAKYAGLGLAEDVFNQHVAFDIGARDMTLEMVERLDAPAVVANFSRLLIDPNREPDQPGFIPEASDGIAIPGNVGLDREEVGHRMRTYHEVFHDTVALQLLKMRRSGVTPIVVGVHSFTPIMQGAGRPWEVGLLWNRDPRLAVRLLAWLRRDPQLTVGDNEPYSGRVLGHSMDEHGGRNGFANVVLEVRQDLIGNPEQAQKWGKLASEALQEVTQDIELFGIQHY
jgi:predicted N-formylglutamate amidohydrolase